MAKSKKGAGDRKATRAKAGKRSRFIAPPAPTSDRAAARAEGEAQFFSPNLPKGRLRWDPTRKRIVHGTAPSPSKEPRHD